MRLNKETKSIIREALNEDIGKKDITTLLTIPAKTKVKAVIVSQESGILCGIDVAKYVFTSLSRKGGGFFRGRSKRVKFRPFKKDGSSFKRNEEIASIEGCAQTILIGERVALNFLSHLSGIATLTNEFVKKVSGTKTLIYDTRKTTPNLRFLEKYAVRVGGGRSHRKNLSEFILIKDNHLRAGRFIERKNLNEQNFKNLISRLKAKVSSKKIEVEVENLRDFEIVSKCKPDIIMLDNFRIGQIKKAVALRNRFYPKIKLESSGGVNLANVRRIAQTGVDLISIGLITHSCDVIDFSLEVK